MLRICERTVSPMLQLSSRGTFAQQHTARSGEHGPIGHHLPQATWQIVAKGQTKQKTLETHIFPQTHLKRALGSFCLCAHKAAAAGRSCTCDWADGNRQRHAFRSIMFCLSRTRKVMKVIEASRNVLDTTKKPRSMFVSRA